MNIGRLRKLIHILHSFFLRSVVEKSGSEIKIRVLSLDRTEQPYNLILSVDSFESKWVSFSEPDQQHKEDSTGEVSVQLPCE